MESRRVHLFMTMVSACECSVDRTKLCMQWNIVGIDTWAFAEGKRFAFSKNQKPSLQGPVWHCYRCFKMKYWKCRSASLRPRAAETQKCQIEAAQSGEADRFFTTGR